MSRPSRCALILAACCGGLFFADAARSAGATAQTKTPPPPQFGQGPFTVAAWIRTAADGTILAKAPTGDKWEPEGKTLFVRGGRVCYDIGWVGTIHGAKKVADGAWHHVAITAPKAYEIYVDGQLDASGPLKAGADDDGHTLRIGFTSPNFPEHPHFKGLMQDVCVFAKALSAEEIKAVQTGGGLPAGLKNALLARWTFDGDAKDSSGNGRDVMVRDGALSFADGRGSGGVSGGSAGKALSLDGRTYLEMPAGPPPPPAGPDCGAVRAAIADLAGTFGADYPRASEFLSRLDAIEKPLAAAQAHPEDRPALDEQIKRAEAALADLRQEAFVRDNPLVRNCGKILFIRRKTYQSSHYYTDYIDGCKFFGGNLSVLDLKTGAVSDVVPEMKDGIFGRFDLSFDAAHIVFDWKKDGQTGFRIYEIGMDGHGLRQITFAPDDEQELVRKYRTVRTPTGIPYASGTDDMHPCYLPCGDIVFVSTRCQKGILCDGPDVLTTTVLYRMDRDGHDMRPLSFNSVSEATPSIMQDGRILYTRWEYVDKGGSACKCIWAMNPDGTNSVEIWGNNIPHPTTRIDARDIPGRGNWIVCTGAPHMPLGVGCILRLDTIHSLRTLVSMTNLTPDIDTPDEHGFRHLRNGKWVHDLVGPLFREPYPLADGPMNLGAGKYFLVSHNPADAAQGPTAYGLYLLDEFGNRTLIYKDSDFSCWGPVPLRPRPTPPVLPPGQGAAKNYDKVGTVYLLDVYEGLTGIDRGRVKYLRVMEDVPRPWSARRYWPGDERKQQHAVVSMDGHTAVKYTHGIVPVEADGSAYFLVPADRNIFFQALDANYMELQRMRTFVNLRPGETRGCLGCHEEKRTVPSSTMTPMALRHGPLAPVAQPGETVPRAMHYVTDVQPILDKYCVRCHSGKEPKAGLDFTGELTEQFSRSYENIIKRHLAGQMVDEIGFKHGNIDSTDPLTYGSHTSKLAEQVLKGHNGVKLTLEEWIRLVTWIDSNAQYYGVWEGRRNIKYKDLPDFRPLPKVAPTELSIEPRP